MKTRWVRAKDEVKENEIGKALHTTEPSSPTSVGKNE